MISLDYFNQPDDADVLLHVRTHHAGDDEPENAAKRRRVTRSHFSNVALEARTFYGHAIVLKSQSAFFKTRLSGPWRQDAMPAGGPAAEDARIRHNVVILLEAGQSIDAMEVALRCMYSQALPGNAAGNGALLPQALWIADGLGATRACEVLAQGMSEVPDQAIDLGFLHIVYGTLAGIAHQPFMAALLERCLDRLLQLLGNLPTEVSDEDLAQLIEAMPDNALDHSLLPKALEALPGLREGLATDALRDQCLQRLVHTFGDVPAVISSEELRQRFLALPYAAVLLWSTSDDLRVDSENCVVFLLSLWVKARKQAGNGCTPEQLEQLACQVRVINLGPSYLHVVLPKLQWFKGCSGMKHQTTLMTIKSLHLGQGVFSGRDLAATWRGPPSWCAEARLTSSTTSRALKMCLDGGRLEELYGGQTVLSTGTVYANGFHIDATVGITDKGSRFTLSLFAGISRAAMKEAGVPLSDEDYVQCRMELAVNDKAGSPVKVHTLLGCYGFAQRGYYDFFRMAACSINEVVAPYLVDGSLLIEAKLREVDAFKMKKIWTRQAA